MHVIATQPMEHRTIDEGVAPPGRQRAKIL